MAVCCMVQPQNDETQKVGAASPCQLLPVLQPSRPPIVNFSRISEGDCELSAMLQLLCGASMSVKLVVDAEVRPGDVIGVEEHGDGLPRVLRHQLLQPLRQLVLGRRDDPVGRLVSGGAMPVGACGMLLFKLPRLLGLVQCRPEVLTGVRAHVGQFPGDEQRLAVSQVLQHVALGQEVVWAVFTQDAVSQVVQETQEEAARGVGVWRGQVRSGKSVAGPEQEGAQVVEAEARARTGQNTS